MKYDAINEYLKCYLLTGDENAFHSLLEIGSEVVQIIESVLRNGVEGITYVRILNLLQELRCKRSSDMLFQLLEEADQARWRATFDAYCYNEPPEMDTKLKHLAERLKAENPKDPRLSVVAEVLT